MDTHTTVEAEVVRLAQARSDALVRKDRVTLERLLADEFRYINAHGDMGTRAEYLDGYVDNPALRWQAQVMDEVQVQVYGCTAILTCRVHDRATFGDQTFDAFCRSTFVWLKRNGAWQCVVGHTTAIAPSA